MLLKILPSLNKVVSIYMYIFFIIILTFFIKELFRFVFCNKLQELVTFRSVSGYILG